MVNLSIFNNLRNIGTKITRYNQNLSYYCYKYLSKIKIKLNNLKLYNLLFIILIVAYVFLYIYYYPHYFTFADEAEYFRMSYLLQHGKIIISDILEVYRYVPFENHYSPYYPIGQAILIIPFMVFGLKTLFSFGLVFHLFNLFLFYKILKKLDIDPYFSLLYLVYPGILFYTKTIMTELPTIFFTLLGFYYYILADDPLNNKKYPLLTGIYLGVSCLIRYTNLLIALPLLIIPLLTNRKKFYYILLGFVPIAIFILILNTIIYGSPFTIGQSYDLVTDKTTFYTFMDMLFKYALSLLFIFPFMLLSPFYYKGRYKKEVISLVIFVPIIFSYLNSRPFHFDFIRNLIIGPRYIFPIIPFFLITYTSLLSILVKYIFKISTKNKTIYRNNGNNKYSLFMKYINKSNKITLHITKIIVTVLTVLMLVGSIKMNSLQYNYTERLLQIMQVIYANTEDGSLIISDTTGFTFINENFGNRYAINYLITDPREAITKFNGKIYILFVEPSPNDTVLNKRTALLKLKETLLIQYHTKISYEQKGSFNLIIYEIIG